MIIREPTEREKRSFWDLADGERHDPRIRDIKGAFIGEELVAVAGVMRDPAAYGSIFEEDAEWVGFFQVKENVKVAGHHFLIAMRHYLKTQTQPIVIQHDDAYPQAEKLLRILGFHPTHVMRRDLRNSDRILRIWKWQPSPPSRC